MEMINLKCIYISDVNIYDWGFVLDSINRGGGREGISGGEAAPDGVATQTILVYEKGGGGYGLWPYLSRVIMDEYGFILDIIDMEVMKERGPHKAEPISAAVEGRGVIFSDGALYRW